MAPDLYEILRPRACLICARGSVDAKHIRGRKLPLQVIRKRCRLVNAELNRAGGGVERLGVLQPATAFCHSPYLALAGFVAISRAIGSRTRQTFSTRILCPAAFG